jgi:hypothetical protein
VLLVDFVQLLSNLKMLQNFYFEVSYARSVDKQINVEVSLIKLKNYKILKIKLYNKNYNFTLMYKKSNTDHFTPGWLWSGVPSYLV